LFVEESVLYFGYLLPSILAAESSLYTKNVDRQVNSSSGSTRNSPKQTYYPTSCSANWYCILPTL